MGEGLALLRTEDLATGLALLGHYAYVTTFPRGMLVIDVSDPRHLEKVEALEVRGSRPRVSDSLLYLIEDKRLHLIHVSSPTSPREVGSYTAPGVPETAGTGLPGNLLDQFFDVATSGQYVFLASSLSGLRVLDISDPTSPRQVAQLDTPGVANSVVAQGNYVYLAAHSATKGEQCWSCLQIVDVSDPYRPSLVDSVETEGYKGSIVLANGYIYFVDLQTLWVVDISHFTGGIRNRTGSSATATKGEFYQPYVSDQCYNKLAQGVSCGLPRTAISYANILGLAKAPQPEP